MVFLQSNNYPTITLHGNYYLPNNDDDVDGDGCCYACIFFFIKKKTKIYTIFLIISEEYLLIT